MRYIWLSVVVGLMLCSCSKKKDTGNSAAVSDKMKSAVEAIQPQPPKAPTAQEATPSWKIASASLKDAAPTGGGQMTVTLFAANKKPRYLYLQLEFTSEPNQWALEDFTVRTAGGQHVRGAPTIARTSPTTLTLIYDSESGWDAGDELFLHGLEKSQPFKTR